jgi:structural maintenance of chromosome 1
MLLTQLDRYKELKEQVRKKVAMMTQQLEKLQWEQKADKERLAFEKRRHGEVQVPWTALTTYCCFQ